MDQQHKKIIRDNHQELADVTKDVDKIIQAFADRGLLNVFMVRHLQSYKEQRRRTFEFYEMCMGRGPTAFDALLSVLRFTENFSAEKILSRDKVTSYNTAKPEMLCPAIDELDIGSSELEMKSAGKILVKRHPDGIFMDSVDENALGNIYRMRSNPRGYALLINIFKTPGRDDRTGSDQDLLKLHTLFSQLGFKCIQKRDLTDEEIKQEIRILKTNPDLMKTDCLIVFIMCHGNQRREHDTSVDLFASNGLSVNSNWIVDQFQSSDVTLPEGKPRLFFFQACRVPPTDTDSGTSTDSSTSTDNNSASEQNVETDSELISKGRNENGGQRLYKDTFIGYSTVPGNYSMRDPKTGSWFVQVFCDVIAEKAWKYDFDDMWREIDDRIEKKSCWRGQQTTEQVKRRFGKLYFNPRLYDNGKDPMEVFLQLKR